MPLAALLWVIGPLVLIGGVMLYVARRGGTSGGTGTSSGGVGSQLKMRKSARVTTPSVRFGDVAGCDEAVEELAEMVELLRDPERFRALGARIPRGVILWGPPGTGKTLLAKAVAGEAGVAFFAVSGSDFVEALVGVGASRVRDLFAQAKKEGSAVIFIDEIDAVGRARGAGPNANQESENTLNQLLVEMDGFGTDSNVVVLAATNRLDLLDKALTRPGRFDRQVRVAPPGREGRLEILRLHAKGKPMADEADLERMAAVTGGASGADLANILNEAALMAARKGRAEITSADLEEGQLRHYAGPQRRESILTPAERERVAWHESGHCLAAELCPTHAKAQKVTILARGQAAGLAFYGSEDKAMHSPQDLHESMVVAMAGRAAEQVRFGNISSGAANDLEQVNGMARAAVETFGFSPRVGQIVSHGPGGHPARLSEHTMRLMDGEVSRLVDDAYREAVALLVAHQGELDALAGALLEEEQVDRERIEAVLGQRSAPAERRRPRLISVLPTDRPPLEEAEAPPLAAAAPVRGLPRPRFGRRLLGAPVGRPVLSGPRLFKLARRRVRAQS
jgi:cell division protease FtsH